jgi:hypothetical protein
MTDCNLLACSTVLLQQFNLTGDTVQHWQCHEALAGAAVFSYRRQDSQTNFRASEIYNVSVKGDLSGNLEYIALTSSTYAAFGGAPHCQWRIHFRCTVALPVAEGLYWNLPRAVALACRL